MNIDRKLLGDLYKIDHSSGNEWTMITYILNYCYKIENIKLELDHYNNLFIEKNTTNPDLYPCVVAHMDEFNDYYGTKTLYQNKEFILAKIDNKQVSLGADDSNGICIALQLLKELPDLKIVFTTEEEVGGLGAEQAKFNEEFFKNCKFLLQADRRGKSDLITFTNGLNVTSTKFLDDYKDIIKKYGYSSARGTFTDIGILAEHLQLSACNISCGYYNEHTDKEITNIIELENCLNFIYDLIVNSKDEIYKITVSKYTPSRYAYGGAYSYEDKYGELCYHCAKCSTFDCNNCKYY